MTWWPLVLAAFLLGVGVWALDRKIEREKAVLLELLARLGEASGRQLREVARDNPLLADIPKRVYRLADGEPWRKRIDRGWV